MEKLLADFSIGLFVWQSLLFVGLVLLLKKFAWKPILDAVGEREEFIAKSLEDAEHAKQELIMLKSRNEDLLKEARAERDTLIKEARDTKDRIVNEAKDEAKTQADKLMETARESIENEKLKAITELKNQVATLSIDIAEKILKQDLASEDKQKALVNGMLEEVNLN